MRTMLTMLAVLLVGCGGPRKPIYTVDQAQAERRQLDLTVKSIYDAMEVKGITQGSHLLEVRVEGGAPELDGRIITLPYDEWAVGKPPPRVGSRVQVSPREWVVTAANSKGKPLGGWDGRAKNRNLR